jgi:hypothetical protein
MQQKATRSQKRGAEKRERQKHRPTRSRKCAGTEPSYCARAKRKSRAKQQAADTAVPWRYQPGPAVSCRSSSCLPHHHLPPSRCGTSGGGGGGGARFFFPPSIINVKTPVSCLKAGPSGPTRMPSAYSEPGVFAPDRYMENAPSGPYAAEMRRLNARGPKASQSFFPLLTKRSGKIGGMPRRLSERRVATSAVEGFFRLY